MIPAKHFYKGIAQLRRTDRIRLGLLILGMTAEDAAEACGKSVASVNMALSRGEREGTLKALEEMLHDRLP